MGWLRATGGWGARSADAWDEAVEMATWASGFMCLMFGRGGVGWPREIESSVSAILAEVAVGRKRTASGAKKMAQETEIKLRIADKEGLQRALKKMKAKHAARGTGRVHEYNVLFDAAEGTLAKREQMLRIRTETREGKRVREQNGKPEVTLTFKGPADGSSGGNRGEQHKVREEIETQVSDGDSLAKVLEGLGMRIFFRYEKYRTTFRLPESQRWAKELKIELDETPIGTFVELEGPAEAIDRAAEGLGFSKRDYITENYLVLYREECRRQSKQPGDMVFTRSRAARGAR